MCLFFQFQEQLVVVVIALVTATMVALQCVAVEGTISSVNVVLKNVTANSIGAAMLSARNVKLKNGYQFANEYSQGSHSNPTRLV